MIHFWDKSDKEPNLEIAIKNLKSAFHRNDIEVKKIKTLKTITKKLYGEKEKEVVSAAIFFEITYTFSEGD